MKEKFIAGLKKLGTLLKESLTDPRFWYMAFGGIMGNIVAHYSVTKHYNNTEWVACNDFEVKKGDRFVMHANSKGITGIDHYTKD